MIVKAFVAGGVGILILRAVPKEAQCPQRSCRGIRTRHPTALDRDRIARQRESDNGDTGRRALACRIRHQTIGRADSLQKVAKGGKFEPIQQIFVSGRIDHGRPIQGARCRFGGHRLTGSDPRLPAVRDRRPPPKHSNLKATRLQSRCNLSEQLVIEHHAIQLCSRLGDSLVRPDRE